MTDEQVLRRGRRIGDEIRRLDDDELVNRIACGEGEPNVREARSAELQRRATERLKESVDQFSRGSSWQANVMIVLTVAIIVLTVALLLQASGCLPAYG